MTGPRQLSAEHVHTWRATGQVKEIGGVAFTVDECTKKGCTVHAARRTDRLTSPTATFTPADIVVEQSGPPILPEPCAGVGEQPQRVTLPTRSYRLQDGTLHTLCGRGVCPCCGRLVAFTDDEGLYRHKPPKENP